MGRTYFTSNIACFIHCMGITELLLFFNMCYIKTFLRLPKNKKKTIEDTSHNLFIVCVIFCDKYNKVG